MLKDNKINATSTHDNETEAVKAAQERSKNIKIVDKEKPVAIKETKKTREDLNYDKVSNQFKNNRKALTIRQLNFLLNTTKGTKEERDKVRKELNSRPKKGLLDFIENIFSDPEVLEEVRKEQEKNREFRKKLTDGGEVKKK